jgi:hypothetical protein
MTEPQRQRVEREGLVAATAPSNASWRGRIATITGHRSGIIARFIRFEAARR